MTNNELYGVCVRRHGNYCVVCENKLRLLFRLLLFASLLLLWLKQRDVFAVAFFL